MYVFLNKNLKRSPIAWLLFSEASVSETLSEQNLTNLLLVQLEIKLFEQGSLFNLHVEFLVTYKTKHLLKL